MIYTASYFTPETHHGLLISISRGVPQGFRIYSRLPFFTPSEMLLNLWKKEHNQDTYINQYKKECLANFSLIKDWLNTLEPQTDQTLLCYEKAGEFCHRNLAIKFVEKYRPDCYGGCDVNGSQISSSARLQLGDLVTIGVDPKGVWNHQKNCKGYKYEIVRIYPNNEFCQVKEISGLLTSQGSPFANFKVPLRCQ